MSIPDRAVRREQGSDLGEAEVAGSWLYERTVEFPAGLEARSEFERAASLTRNERERALLLGRAADCG